MVAAWRFEVFLVVLDPTRGSEIQKTRPCVVVSPDELNQYLATVIVAPMTTGGKPFASRIPCTFMGKEARIVLEQLRTVDKSRLVRRLGRIDDATANDLLDGIAEMFAP